GEHVPAHDGRAGAAEDVLGERRARVDLAAFLAVALAERLERDQPVVELLTADPERMLWRLVRAGDETVDRHRDVQLQLAHRSSLRRHTRRTVQRVRGHRSSQEVDEAGDNPVNAIATVLMLREGWGVQKVTVVVGLRPYTAKAHILPAQTTVVALLVASLPGRRRNRRRIRSDACRLMTKMQSPSFARSECAPLASTSTRPTYTSTTQPTYPWAQRKASALAFL